jgi:hypothetical protein
LHAAPAQVTQELGPRLGRLTLAIGNRDQLLGAIAADPDDHQGAQPRILKADVEVHAIRQT